jgi:hypothetical protein
MEIRGPLVAPVAAACGGVVAVCRRPRSVLLGWGVGVCSYLGSFTVDACGFV